MLPSPLSLTIALVHTYIYRRPYISSPFPNSDRFLTNTFSEHNYKEVRRVLRTRWEVAPIPFKSTAASAPVSAPLYAILCTARHRLHEDVRMW